MADPEFLNKVFKALPVPSLVLLPDSPKFTVVEVNDAYLDITNVSRADLIGNGFFDTLKRSPYFNTVLWKDLLEKTVRERVASKTPVFDYEVPIKGTSEFEIRQLVTSITPIFGTNNEIEFIIRSVTDVTEMLVTKQSEKTAHDNLIKNERFLNETQRIVRVGSWEADLVHEVINWSDVVREIYEVNADYCPEFTDPLDFFKDAENRATFEDAINEAIVKGSMIDLELIIVTAKGNERWIRVTGQAELKDGNCWRIYGAIQDINDKKIIQQDLLVSKNRFESLIQTVGGIVWEADAQSFEYTFVSDQVKNILGYTSQEWLNEPDFWQNHIHPDDRQVAISYCYQCRQEGKDHALEYRMIRSDGSQVWIKDVVSVIIENGKSKVLRGIMMDVSEGRRSAEMERLEKNVLELNSNKKISIEHVLTMYLNGIEVLFPHMKCSILQVKNNHLHNWSSPSLPKEYVDNIENLAIGLNVGSCGSAAFLKEQVIVSDIENDPIWADYKHIALKFNLRACWSHPILDAENEVIATFGIYYHEVKLPGEEELNVIEKSKAILKVILENRQSSEILKETFLLMNQGQELAHFGNWQWDIPSNRVTWSDELYNIYGLESAVTKPTFEGYQNLLHPDDRVRVNQEISRAKQLKVDTVFEERIIRTSGEIRYLKSWGRIKADEKGNPVKVVGASLDITESRKIQEELLLSEARLRSLVDALRLSNERYEYVNKTTNDAIYDWDLASDHIAWGEGYHRLFGYEITDEKFPVKIWESHVHPDDFTTLNTNLNQALADKNTQDWHAEYRYEKAGGSYAFIQENGYILRNAAGMAIRMIGALRDISERKNTQIKLVRKSKFLAAIAEVNSSLLQFDNWFAAINESFSVVGRAVSVDRVYYFENYVDAGSGKAYTSQKFEWNAGTFNPQIDNPKLQNVLLESLPDLMNPLKKNNYYSAVIRHLPDSDFKADLEEQDIKSLLILPVFVKSKFYGYLGFDDCRQERDWDEDEISFLKAIAVNLGKVIESQEADLELLAAYEEKNRTLESIQDGFFAVNKDWIVTYWNKEAEKLLDIKREDIVNHNFWNIYNQVIPSKFYHQYNKAFSENIPVRFEEYFAPLNRWFEVNAFPVKAGLTVYFKNITERKRAEENLKALHLKLENNVKILAISNAELEQFAYVASHDLQEPLRMVTSFLTLLEKKYGESLDDKAKKYIFYAVDGAKRMRQIILDLLDFSRVGKSEEKLQEIELNELITEIILLHRKTIEEKNAEIKFDSLPTLRAFKAPLRQIFQNLISNGLKYQHEGCIPQIFISFKETGTHWEFAVRDNGIGIDEQYFDKIFIIFQRLHNKEEYSGTGMGLAITKKIVESMGGEIRVESQEGKGSTFYFTILKRQQTTL